MMWFRIIVLCVFTSVTVSATYASAYIKFTDNCLDAQKAVYSLRIAEAKQLITKEAQANSDNRAADYLNVMQAMLVYITIEDDASYTTFDSLATHAISRIKDCDDQKGYRDYLLEEIYFFSSVVQGKRGNALSAANAVRKAYSYGEDVLKDYPNFVMAKKTLGLLQSGFGSLPSTYKKLVSFMGYDSDMDGGITYLEACVKDKTQKPEWALMRKEAQFYLASVYLYLKNDKDLAWTTIDHITRDYKTNPLSAFARVNVADKCKYNDEVIRVAQAAPRNTLFAPIPFLDFALGKAQLQKLDSDADKALLRYIKSCKGKSYIKSCYQKLAWHAAIQNNKSDFDKYVIAIKQNGNTSLEEDAQAQAFAESGKTPNSYLLKSRLLFDGGYYASALEIIRPTKKEDYTPGVERTTYFYRKGRIYDALGNTKLAEAFYKATIAEGEQLEQYYASFASLYLAEVYERTGKTSDARKYFEKAMKFDANKEYEKSVEYKAKAGLRRLDSKS